MKPEIGKEYKIMAWCSSTSPDHFEYATCIGEGNVQDPGNESCWWLFDLGNGYLENVHEGNIIKEAEL